MELRLPLGSVAAGPVGAELEPFEFYVQLPVGFVMQLLEDLKVDDPNKVFAWPTLAEMAPVKDDKLLYSLIPRVSNHASKVSYSLSG